MTHGFQSTESTLLANSTTAAATADTGPTFRTRRKGDVSKGNPRTRRKREASPTVQNRREVGSGNNSVAIHHNNGNRGYENSGSGLVTALKIAFFLTALSSGMFLLLPWFERDEEPQPAVTRSFEPDPSFIIQQQLREQIEIEVEKQIQELKKQDRIR